MKLKIKKILMGLMAAAMLTSTVGCGSDQAILDSSATREQRESDGWIVIIDEEAVALAGQISSVDPRCSQIIDAINVEREKAGLGKLNNSAALANAAAVRAQEQEQLFSHTRPNGTDWWTVDSTVCYGENLAKGYTTANSVTAAWMASPTHKSVMLDNYKTCGIGIYTSASGVTFIAAEFGY